MNMSARPLPAPRLPPSPDGKAAWIYQGEFRVSSVRATCFMTILGSCVSVCMRDPMLGIGGMNHFLLPEDERSDSRFPSLQLRYGSYAIERLTNAILSKGGRRERLEVKVFGGANIGGFASTIGSRNADFVERYIARENMRITAHDLRGAAPRKLRYYPSTGQAFVAVVRELEALETLRSESETARNLVRAKAVSSIEVF
jgi:chemotaxis protein CheD